MGRIIVCIDRSIPQRKEKDLDGNIIAMHVRSDLNGLTSSRTWLTCDSTHSTRWPCSLSLPKARGLRTYQQIELTASVTRSYNSSRYTVGQMAYLHFGPSVILSSEMSLSYIYIRGFLALCVIIPWYRRVELNNIKSSERDRTWPPGLTITLRPHSVNIS